MCCDNKKDGVCRLFLSQMGDHVHGDAGGDAPQGLGRAVVYRDFQIAGPPGIVRADAGVLIGKAGNAYGMLVGVDLRRMLLQPAERQQQRVCHLCRVGVHGGQGRGVNGGQKGAQQVISADIDEVHRADDADGTFRDAQFLPRFPQGALERRLALLPFAARETDLAGLADRGRADLIQKASLALMLHQRHKDGRAAPLAHEGRLVAGVVVAQMGNVHVSTPFVGKKVPRLSAGERVKP